MIKYIATFFKEESIMSTATVDIVHQIGETAGKIFRALEVRRDQALSDLKKATKIENADLLQQGLGWLAREGKLNITTNLKGELRVSLK